MSSFSRLQVTGRSIRPIRRVTVSFGKDTPARRLTSLRAVPPIGSLPRRSTRLETVPSIGLPPRRPTRLKTVLCIELPARRSTGLKTLPSIRLLASRTMRLIFRWKRVIPTRANLSLVASSRNLYEPFLSEFYGRHNVSHARTNLNILHVSWT